MRTKLFTLFALVMLFMFNANATVWRVSNVSGAGAHFTSLQAAINDPSVVNGDVIYLEPSAVSYGNITLNKSLTIIGNGFFLGENPETQANPNMSRIGSFTFSTGSDGAVVVGCYFSSMVSIHASNVRLERNYFYYPSSGALNIGSNQSNIFIVGNYINSFEGFNTLSALINNLYVYNNLFKCSSTAINTGWNTSAVVENNVIESGNVLINNTVFNNNIMVSGTFTHTDSNFSNNIGHSTQFGTANGNQQNVNMNTVFVGTGSTDGKWQLKAGSPAIATGVGGIDCGMFGGPYPYKLSGLPQVPSIFKYEQVYNAEDQEVEVVFSVKSNN